MHIQDGIFVNTTQLIVYAVITILLLAVLYYKNKGKFNEKQIPIIAMFAVFAFIIELIDLPLPVAACAHLSLITFIALYDPWYATIVFTLVTGVQVLVGFEGGITTLGVNILNLAIIAPWLAYGIYKLLVRFNQQAAFFISAFLTTTLIGLIVSIEYALSNTFPITYGLTFIVPIEAVVGIIEGVVTVLLMNAIRKIRPELVPAFKDNNKE